MAITRGVKSTATGGNQVSSGTSAVATWAVNPAAGDTVLVFIQCSAALTNVVDNGTTPRTFTEDKGLLSSQGAHIYRANNITLPSAGSYTVTCSIGTAHGLMIYGVSYNGVAAGAPTATNSSSGTSTSVSSLAAAPAAAGGLVFGGFADSSGLNPETVTFTGSVPLTEQFRNTNGSSFWPVACADGLTDVTRTLTWTLGDSVAWASVVCAYDATAGAAAVIPNVAMAPMTGG